MGNLERRLEDLRRMRDAGTISEAEHAAARQRAIDEGPAPRSGPFGWGFKFVLGGIAAMIVLFIVVAFAAGAFVRSSGESCAMNGTPVPCHADATAVAIH